MSRSPTEATPVQEARDYLEAFRQTYRLAERGRSFSGREPNTAFLNLGDGSFADVSAVSGLAFPDDGRAVAVTDWDLDGDLDLWIANRTAPRLRLMRNEWGAGAPFVAFRLEGTASNRDAIGARVELRLHGARDGRRIAERRAGSGFLSQSSAWLHFGLGSASGDPARIDAVTVTWPGGEPQSYSGIEPGGRYVLVQGEEDARPWTPRERTVRLRPEALDPPPGATPSRVVLTGRPAMPPLAYRDFAGEEREVPAGPDGPVLLNLWASWCLPCVGELTELAGARERLAAAGVRVLALSVDGLDGGGATGPAEARAMLSRLRVPFPAGMAHADLLETLQVLHDRLFSRHLALPVPTSFLIDEDGRVAAIYRGPVALERLLADVERLGLPPQARRAHSTPFAGRWLGGPQALRATTIAERFIEEGRLETAVFYLREALDELPPGHGAEADEISIRLADVLMTAGAFDEAIPLYRATLERAPGRVRETRHLADALAATGRLGEAAEAYRTVIATDPTDGLPYRGLGTVLLRLGRFDEAAGALREALARGPETAAARHDLGVALAASGELDAARHELERAVELRPDYAEARNNLGVVLLRSGRRDEAIAQFRRALDARPDYADAAANLASALRD